MAKKDDVMLRRLRVASLLTRGLTQREIVAALEKQNFTTQDKDGNIKPWSLGTINSDVKKIRAEWEAELNEKARSHAARLRAEIQEVKRSAWAAGDRRIVLSAIEQEMKLLKLESINILLGQANDWDAEEMSDEELAAIARGQV